ELNVIRNHINVKADSVCPNILFATRLLIVWTEVTKMRTSAKTRKRVRKALTNAGITNAGQLRFCAAVSTDAEITRTKRCAKL
ncbi:hypothetical protein B4U80_05028, partial [Leptotrombidium deliense]